MGRLCKKCGETKEIDDFAVWWVYKNGKRVEGKRHMCISCYKEYGRKHAIKYARKHPIRTIYQNIKSRCNYFHGASYKHRGIKVIMSFNDLKNLWNKDGADKMICPSIDRINPSGNYTVDNCRFIEWKEHRNRPKAKQENKSSRFKGVTRIERANRWMAYLGKGNEQKYLGLFKNEVDAAKEYDKEAAKLYGIDAVLNFND